MKILESRWILVGDVAHRRAKIGWGAYDGNATWQVVGSTASATAALGRSVSRHPISAAIQEHSVEKKEQIPIEHGGNYNFGKIVNLPIGKFIYDFFNERDIEQYEASDIKLYKLQHVRFFRKPEYIHSFINRV